MKSPNASNIDQWLFHYFEGDLSPNEESMLENFLLDNPQFDTQFEAWGAARITNVQLEYQDKGALLKPLVAPAMLSRLTFLTALGINAVLALFIIFGGNQTQVDYALEANHLTHLKHGRSTFQANNDVRNVSVNGQSNFISGEYLSGSNRVETSIHNTDFSEHGASINQNQTDSDFSNQLFSNELNIPSVVYSNDLPVEQQIELNNSSSTNSTTSNVALQIESTELSNAQELNSEENISVINNESLVSDNSLANSNSSPSNPNPKSESEGRDKKHIVRSNRFKSGGELMLINSRDVEYMIPGFTRNQVNFAHVASDFSNSIYSNSYVQWPGQSNAMLSNQLGLDVYLPEAKSGIGIQLMYDRYAQGAINNVQFSATYSPKFFLTKNIVLEPAIRFRMGGTGVNRNQLAPGSWIELDRANAFVYSEAQQNAQVNRSINQDFGLGILLNTKWGFIGANADNLIGSKNHALYYGSDLFADRMPVFVNAMIGTEYESRNKKMRLSGQMVYQNFGDLNKFWFGSRVKYNSLSLGASVSSAGEPMFSLGWMSRQFSLLYSADYANSQMSGNKHLSHQLTMRITLKESRLRKLMLN
jgi:hypothetical protein